MSIIDPMTTLMFAFNWQTIIVNEHELYEQIKQTKRANLNHKFILTRGWHKSNNNNNNADENRGYDDEKWETEWKISFWLLRWTSFCCEASQWNYIFILLNNEWNYCWVFFMLLGCQRWWAHREGFRMNFEAVFRFVLHQPSKCRVE